MAWDPLAQLTDRQQRLLRDFAELLLSFNRRINLVSREDEAALFDRHILHSLCLTYRSFPADAVVVDWGTGGGLPAIPLAIALPEVHVVAVDAVGKKVQAVQAIARRLGLRNLGVRQGRAEAFEGTFDYSVSRATAPLTDLWQWHERAARQVVVVSDDRLWRPGLVCLKGGELAVEKAEMPQSVRMEEVEIPSLLTDPYFTEKVILSCSREYS